MSNITIYTDASLCDKTQTGGWACWVKTGDCESTLHSGKFKTGNIKSSNQAELMAICNAITVAAKLRTEEHCRIVVVTDSQHAIFYIGLAQKHRAVPHRTGKKGGKSPNTYDANLFKIAQMIWKAVPTGFELRVNKVKAHSNGDGKRSYVNRLVDKAAKKARKAAA